MRIRLTMTIGHDATDPTSNPPDATLNLSQLIRDGLEVGLETSVEIVEESQDSMIIQCWVDVDDDELEGLRVEP